MMPQTIPAKSPILLVLIYKLFFWPSKVYHFLILCLSFRSKNWMKYVISNNINDYKIHFNFKFKLKYIIWDHSSPYSAFNTFPICPPNDNNLILLRYVSPKITKISEFCFQTFVLKVSHYLIFLCSKCS